MNTLIQEIIAKDLAARKRLEQRKEEKKLIKKEIEAQKDVVFKTKQQEAEMRLARLKAENKEELAKIKAQKTQEYEAASKRLHQTMREHENQWIDELFQRCIHN